jgi:hypothetical protein
LKFPLTARHNRRKGDSKIAVMKLLRVKTLLLAFALLTAACIRADVIVDNLNQPTDNYFGPMGDDSNTNDFLIGQEFTLPSGPTSYQLNQVNLLLSATGGGGNITVSIWKVGPDNNPTNEIAVVSSRFVANAGGVVDFVPSTSITLPTGIYYVVAAPTTPADSGLVSWAYAHNTNWTGSGILGGFADTSSGVWGNLSITNLPQQLSVEATPLSAGISIRQQAGVTALSWPSTLNGFVAESATNLAAPVWQAITKCADAGCRQRHPDKPLERPSAVFPAAAEFCRGQSRSANRRLGGPIGTEANSNDFLIGQEFTLPAGNYTLNKVTLLLNPINGNSSVTVSIWNVGSDHNPTNEIAVVESQSVLTEGNVDFVPSVPITLPSGTYYVVAAPTTTADNAMLGWDWTFSSAFIGFGMLGGFAYTYPGAWENSPIGNGPYQMSVQATPAPP